MRGEWMEKEIREQVEVLGKGAETYRDQLSPAIAGREYDMVLLAARGSSDNAALFARYLIEVALGIPVSLAAPSVLTRFGTRVRYPRCLAIGVSQSGAAPDVAEVLGALRSEGHTTLAITNTANSRLTREAEFSLLLDAGVENSVAATKTYSSSLLALYEVVRLLAGPVGALPDPRGKTPDANWMERTLEAAQEASGPIVRCSPIFSLGRGYGFATAHESALKLMECALIPAKAYSSADFEHGPKALASYGSAAVVFDGPKPHLSDQGCLVVEAPIAPAPEVLRPMWEVITGQWLALCAARARGLDPDKPQNLKKVTETL